MATMKCPSCNAQIDTNSFTCEYCGYSLTSTPSLTPGPRIQPASDDGGQPVSPDVPPPPGKVDPPPGFSAPPSRPDRELQGLTAIPPGGGAMLDDVVLQNADGAGDATGGAIGEAWDWFKTKPVELVALYIIVDLLSLPQQLYQQTVAPNLGQEAQLVGMVVMGGLGFLLSLVQATLSAGCIIYWLKLIRGQDPRFSDLFKGFRFFFPLVITTSITGLGIMLGMLLLIIPGVILSLGWFFVMYVIVDKNIGYIDAMRASWRLTNGYKAELFILSLLITGVAILGMLACCVGLLVAIPVGAGAVAVVYNRLAEPGNAYLED